MTLRSGVCLLALAEFLGCGHNTTPPAAPSPSGNAALLEPLLLKAKPDKPRSVTDIRENAQNDEEVVMVGQVPPGKVKAFLDDRAAFVLLSAEDIARNKDGFENAPEGCPEHIKMLDDLGVQVELVDQTGAIVRTPVKGLHGIEPLGLIVVKGKAVRQGKKVRILATGFFVEGRSA